MTKLTDAPSVMRSMPAGRQVTSKIIRLTHVAALGPKGIGARIAQVEVRRQVERASQGSVCVIVDSTGLKVCGQGEWHVQKHGEKKGKRWKKLHIGVDDQGQIVASTVTDSNEQDPSQVLALLSQIDQPLSGFVGDGMYDQEPVYAAVEAHSPGVRVIIPPRKDAVLSPRQRPRPPNETSTCWQSRAKVGLVGNGPRVTTHRVTRRTHFRGSNEHSEVGYGQSGKNRRRGKLLLPARCSIGYWSWVVLSPTRSAKRSVHGGSAGAARFVQQRRFFMKPGLQSHLSIDNTCF